MEEEISSDQSAKDIQHLTVVLLGDEARQLQATLRVRKEAFEDDAVFVFEANEIALRVRGIARDHHGSEEPLQLFDCLGGCILEELDLRISSSLGGWLEDQTFLDFVECEDLRMEKSSKNNEDRIGPLVETGEALRIADGEDEFVAMMEEIVDFVEDVVEGEFVDDVVEQTEDCRVVVGVDEQLFASEIETLPIGRHHDDAAVEFTA
jgi:hypothetical protein